MSADPSAALLIIGAEVLSGKVEDANGPFLIRALRQRGIRLHEIRVIDDDIGTIEKAIRELRPKVDYLFTTGGIGPTHDDVTVEAVAKALDRDVAHAAGIIAHLEARYGELDDAKRRLAEIPAGAEMVQSGDNPLPTIAVDNVFVMPGVPALMRACFDNITHRLAGAPIYSAALYLDASESAIAGHLETVQRDHPEIAIGSYPRYDAVDYRVKVTVDSRSQEAVDAGLRALREGLEPPQIVRSEP